ncbi:MAG TPA: hypothetical protein VGR38_12195 [Candidatus Polarisedimenticolia bacterium]|jgi:hypothetical protein|nr:hypothetical protein [Candidatus Polarisedimenticolia bacterium]
MLRRVLLALFMLAASCLATFGHDLWIEPREDSSSPGHLLLRAVVGAGFPNGEETKRATDYQDARYQRMGKIEPLPVFGKEPTLLGSLSGKVPFFAAVTGPARAIDLKPSEVREYLREEVGTDAALIDSMLKNAGSSLHETYSRALKVFVIPRGASRPGFGFPESGQNGGGGVDDVPFGLPLEIVLTRWNPGHDPKKCTAPHAGPCTSLGIRLLKEGKPLGDAFVRLVQADGTTQKLRTNQEGEAVTQKVIERGPVLIAFIELSASQKGRYETRWTNLAIHDLR